MMTRLKLVPPDADRSVIDKLFVLADTDKDGKISFKEFVRLFRPVG
jgi:Ca2+-binding EF-hand superfamily protein